MTSGGGLTDAPRFRVEGPSAVPIACHCDQCRRRPGHFTAATPVPRGAVTVEGAPDLVIKMGAFDGPTGLPLADQIFTSEMGDCSAISDGLPTAPGHREAFR